MNIVNFGLEIIPANETRQIDGILFTSCVFVKVEIDGEDLLSSEAFSGSAINFHELVKSMEGSGRYQIFTCICGISEDAGWSEIEVVHQQGVVQWVFERETFCHFEFDLDQYKYSIQECQKALSSIPSIITQEPQTPPTQQNPIP